MLYSVHVGAAHREPDCQDDRLQHRVSDIGVFPCVWSALAGTAGVVIGSGPGARVSRQAHRMCTRAHVVEVVNCVPVLPPGCELTGRGVRRDRRSRGFAADGIGR